MKDKTRQVAQKPKLDFSTYSDEQLVGIMGMIPAIQKELDRRNKQEKKAALERMRAIAGEVGMTLEELLGVPAKKRGRKRGARKARSKN